MPVFQHASAFLASAAILIAATAAQANPAPTGVWIDHTGRGAVEITNCGSALCGRIVWLKDSGDRDVCGKQVIGNARPTGPGVWDGGWIYDPETRSKYSVELKPLANERLRVVGYMGSKFFSETMHWKRAPANLNRCDGTTTISQGPAEPAPSQLSSAAVGSQPEAREQPTTAALPAGTGTRVAAEPEATTATAGETVAKPQHAETEAAPGALKRAPQVAAARTTAAPAAARPARTRAAKPKDCTIDLGYLRVAFPCPDR